VTTAAGPTVIEIGRRSAAFLSERASASPRLDAELIVAHSLGLRRLDLYLQFDRPLEEEELAPVRALLRRRARGEPVAYLLGEREFFGRAFTVSPAVLVPRPETELLVERVLLWARARSANPGHGLRIADVATGSGCVAVSLAAELSEARVAATDISPEALAIASGNAVRHGVADRVRFLEGSWTEPLRGEERLDILVSNPPYVTTAELDELPVDVRGFEPRLALDGGDDGLDASRALIPAVTALVRPGGFAAVEVDPRRAGAVAALAAERGGGGGTVTVVRDLAGLERVVEWTVSA
jgi:release factor glutamine methyltransferase